MTTPGGGFSQYLNSPQSGSFPQQSASGGDAGYNFTKFNQGTPVPGAIDGSDTGDNLMRPRGTQINKGQLLQTLLLQGISDPDAVLALQQQLIHGGYLNPKARSFLPGDVQPGDATYYAMEKLLNNSIITGKDYQELLSSEAAKNSGKANFDYYLKKFGTDGSGGGAGGPVAFNRTTTNLSSPDEAEAIINNTFESFHGRKATQAEVNTFTQALAAYQTAHPQVSTGTFDPAQGGDTNTTTSGGVSAAGAQQFAENQATSGANQQDAYRHQMVGIMNFFDKAIQGGGG